MSFRKRSEVLNRGTTTPQPVPGRAPISNTRSPIINPNRIPNHSIKNGIDVPTAPIRGMEGLSLRDRNITPRAQIKAFSTSSININELEDNHPGIRPSPASSHQTTSTGSKYLDKLLGHMGLPLGNSLLIEEKGTTEFNSILCRLFAAQGILHNRVETISSTNSNTHLIVLSLNQMFAKELPGIYKGSRKEVKKSKISEERSKITVQNLTEQSVPTRSKDLKIAWRYGLNDKQKKLDDDDDDTTAEGYKNYNHQFDITSRLMPAPTPSEITLISPTQPIQAILQQIEKTIRQHPNKLIRVIVPSLLHPAMYSPEMFKLSVVLSLLHGLRSITKKYGQRCVLMATLSSDIISHLMLVQIENLFDSVMTLEPFKQEMMQFLERAYKTQPNKIQHGLIHILKLPLFSDLGEMHVMKSEWAFRNGRKRFEIEEWGIPVEDNDESTTNNNSNSGISADSHNDHHGHDHSHEKPEKNLPTSLSF